MPKNDGKVGSRAAEARVDEALHLLKEIGFPLDIHTNFLQRRLARVFLAVCDLKPNTRWTKAAYWGDERHHALTTKEIVEYVNANYGERIARGSYDYIKRLHLRHLEAAGLVLAGANRPGSNPNDSKRAYALSSAAAKVVAAYGHAAWPNEVASFLKSVGSLRRKYEQERHMELVPVILPDGAEAKLLKGEHNYLQIAVIKEFLPRFAPGADVLYLGDADKRKIILKRDKLKSLRFFEIAHETLPDIVAYDEKQNWLFLIEAVHTSNPISADRHFKYREMTKDCTAGIVYVSAFKDRKAFGRWAAKISWETEVWIQEDPSHMIHYNGPRFIGPYKRANERASA